MYLQRFYLRYENPKDYEGSWKCQGMKEMTERQVGCQYWLGQDWFQKEVIFQEFQGDFEALKFDVLTPSRFIKLSRCASCVAKCIPPCDLCAYFRNPQGQIISSWILVYLCGCPTISTALKVFGPKKILVYVIGISQILIQKKYAISRN